MMTGARGPTKQYNRRSRVAYMANDTEILHTTARPASANEKQHDSTSGMAEIDIKAVHKQLPTQHGADSLRAADKTTPTAAAAKDDHDEESCIFNQTTIAREGSSKRHIFRFADLPAELRNQIYELSLATEEQVQLSLRQIERRHVVILDREYDEPKLGLNPKLLLINKATYLEGGPILYANKFYVDDPTTLFIFLSSLSAMSKPWIQDLTFDFGGLPLWKPRKDYEHEYLYYLLPAFTALIGTTNLKHFHLHFDAGMYTEEDTEEFSSIFYEDAYLWLEGLVRQKGSKEKAVKVIDISLRPNGGRITGTDSHSTSMLHERLLKFLS